MLKLTKAGRGGIFLSDENNILNIMASRNIDITNLESKNFRSNYDMVKKVFRKGEQIIYEAHTQEHEKNQKVKTGWQIAFPIKHRDHTLGVIYLDNNLLWASPPKECLMVLKIIASQIAIALKNADAYNEIARLKERLEDETKIYREEFNSLPYEADIVGKSNAIRTVLSQIKKVGPTDSSVLIMGETGVGKELVAKAVHRFRNRKNGPFIPVNSATLDPGLIASELFRPEKKSVYRRLPRFKTPPVIQTGRRGTPSSLEKERYPFLREIPGQKILKGRSPEKKNLKSGARRQPRTNPIPNFTKLSAPPPKKRP